MRWRYQIKNKKRSNKYGIIYPCNHLLYNSCTLYLKDGKGIAVIQQRFNRFTKHTYWTEIDPWLVDEIYLNKNFNSYFLLRAKEPENKLYPTVTLRQIMWALRMKPLKKEKWETVFDRKEI